MLLSTNLVTVTKHLLLMISHCNLLPLQYPFQFSFDPTLKQYRFTSNLSFRKRHWIYQCLLLMLAFLIGTIRAQTESKSIFDKITTLFFPWFGVYYAAVVCFYKFEASHFCEFLNQVLTFETDGGLPKTHEKTYNWKDDKARAFVSRITRIGTVSLFSHSVMYSLSCAYDPLVPWSIMPNSFLNVFCGKKECSITTEIFRRLFLFIYSYITMKLMVNLAAMIILLSLLIPTFCIFACLKTLHWSLLQAKLKKDLIRNVQIYRQVQLLCGLYNKIHRRFLLPGIIVSAMCCFSIPGFIVATRFDQLDLSATMIFGNATSVAVCLMIGCFYFAAQFNEICISVFESFKRKLVSCDKGCGNNREAKIARKYVVSLYPLRIQFGQNYFHRLSPLVFLDISADLLIQLILLEQ